MTITDRYHTILNQIAQAAQRAGRNPAEITLVAVSKTWSAAVVVEAYEAGMRHFGENRVEEMVEKQVEVDAHLGPDSGLTWHLIGPLQSRKTPLAADNATVFHALDRLKIANRLANHLQENGRILPVFLEVNVSGEASKTGFTCDRWEEDAQQRQTLQAAAAAIAALPGLPIQGLMTMAPWDAEPAVIRATFRRTRELAAWLHEVAVPKANWSNLSMGMTDDFELAIEEGATHVRIGRAIFGSRH
jgi:pyridoxal phosphate enzyme (YggS family)